MPTAVSLPDTASAPSRASSPTFAIALSLTALGFVAVGFALFALALLDLVALPIGWGVGLCVAGWALAPVARDRGRTAPSAARAP